MPVISTNTAANTAVRYLNINSRDESDSLSKLASGSRITKASDDAAGLAIATRINSDVSALEQASTNANHSISILQTADGGAARISDILQRMKSLASEAASGTVTNDEREYLDAEFSALTEEIQGIAESTRYNGVSLLTSDSDYVTGLDVVVGSDATDTINLKTAALDVKTLALYTDADSDTTYDAGEELSIATQTSAETVLATLDSAISTVSAARADIGAVMSRFEFRVETIDTGIENLSAAASAISDVDIASEQSKLSAASVKVQAAVSAAAQANQMPQNLLKLLQ